MYLLISNELISPKTLTWDFGWLKYALIYNLYKYINSYIS